MMLQLLAGDIRASEWVDPLPPEFITDELQTWAKENIHNLQQLKASGVIEEYIFQQLSELTGVDIDTLKAKAEESKLGNSTKN